MTRILKLRWISSYEEQFNFPLYQIQQLVSPRDSIMTLCIWAELYCQDYGSVQEKQSDSHGPVCWKWGPCRIPLLTPSSCSCSLPAEPKSLPQHPQQEDNSQCHVCAAAPTLCLCIEPPCSCSFAVISLIFCLVSFLPTVCSLICSLFGFRRAHLVFPRDWQLWGQGVEVRRLPEEV